MSTISLSPGMQESNDFLSQVNGGDADTQLVNVGTLALAVMQTGNGQPLKAIDGNTTTDSYIQFNINDQVLFEGKPTPSIRLDIQYLDQGMDTFTIQYDASGGGPNHDGTFLETYPVVKTNTQKIKIASFVLKDVNFANRDNKADFRISDQNDGAEFIKTVSITLLPVPQVIYVDSCGASPYDTKPDSSAIQSCIGNALTGDTIIFTSPGSSLGYFGYIIDKTIFLETYQPKKYLTFTSSDASQPATLIASSDLLGFVMMLQARSTIIGGDAGIQYMTISHLHLDGNRQSRVCLGPDGQYNGTADNWGSWIENECTVAGDAWCAPGTLDLAGTGVSNIVADGVHITNTECGTAFGLWGTYMVVVNSTIDTAGDHVHGAGCQRTDPDIDPIGGWSDGITFFGSNNLIYGNMIIDPSDVGIVFFGGPETVIRNNTIHATTGNHGAFAAIAIHPWVTGDVGFGQVVGNTVINEGDSTCGGIHAGIDLGPHMWGGGCDNNSSNAVGNSTCTLNPAQPKGLPCPMNAKCQKWAYVPAGTTFTLSDNTVTGAQINYLVEGLDLVGTLNQGNNISNAPRLTDWGVSRTGCYDVFWGALDFVAHDPTLPDWKDLRIHCER